MLQRLSPFVLNSLDEEGRQLYDSVIAGLPSMSVVEPGGVLAGPLDAWMRRPDLAQHLAGLGDALRHHGELSATHRELGILAVAIGWNSEYAFTVHAGIARRHGVSDDIISAIAEGHEPPFGNDSDRSIYNFARSVVSDRRVSDEQYRAAADAIGERALVELVLLIGYYASNCFVLNVFDVVALPT